MEGRHHPHLQDKPEELGLELRAHLHQTRSRPAYYDETTSQPYTITSYREKGGERQPVPWKVIGYDADGDGMFTMAEKPDWLVSLSKDGGAGGTAAEEGTATLLKGEMKDMLNERNEGLKKAAPLGSAGNYYDLSTKGGQAARSTANCYVISAPGYYRIPLVYGNAITGGEDNTKSYICNRPTPHPFSEDLFRVSSRIILATISTILG